MSSVKNEIYEVKEDKDSPKLEKTEKKVEEAALKEHLQFTSIPQNTCNTAMRNSPTTKPSNQDQQKETLKRDSKSFEYNSNDNCQKHNGCSYVSYCKTCSIPVCELCVVLEHSQKHELLNFYLLHKLQSEQLEESEKKRKEQVVHLTEVFKGLQDRQNILQSRYKDEQNKVDNFHNYFLQVLQELKDEVKVELELSYDTKMAKLEDMKSEVDKEIMNLGVAEALIKTLLPLPFKIKFVSLKQEGVKKIDALLKLKTEFGDLQEWIDELNFNSNKQIVRSNIRNVYGRVGAEEKKEESLNETQEIENTKLLEIKNDKYVGKRGQWGMKKITKDSRGSNKLIKLILPRENKSDQKLIKSSFPYGRNNCYPPYEQGLQHLHDFNPPHDWAESLFTQEDLSRCIVSDKDMNLVSNRKKMEYHCKFGEFGSQPGQFTEPSGVAVSKNGHILIADANNHRIQAFDMTGVFQKVIGQEDVGSNSNPDHSSKHESNGKESELVYPNRLAVNYSTGEIYVTERSPTHQVRVYDNEGRFVRRFGSHVLQHPRGITVDSLGRIVVVECKVMRVVIFNSSGSVLNRFVVEKKVNFPNGVAVNDKEEIFISDNRRHGIVVFDYHGAFLRTIGGIGITNYPIGVGINTKGELVVADNHNNFNVTIFTQEGKYLRSLESRVKHAQCFDTALLGDSFVVMSSKDFRIYVYHYADTSDSCID